MKRCFVLILSVALALSLVACGNTSSQPPVSEPAPAVSGNESNAAADKVFRVGICQLVQHEALDAATKGFRDALSAKLGDRVIFDEQNASGDSATCSTISNQFVSSNYDLILANATPALQAAVSATDTIPVLGTSITDYATALDIDNWTGVTGYNVSGTSDLGPLDKQAEMIKELFPDAKNVGILYCSAEANSKYQVGIIKKHLADLGFTVTEHAFADSNDVTAVTQTAASVSDVLYIPTDNTAASCTEAINNVAEPAGIPVVCGEEGPVSGCGVAALSISYYDIGFATGEMAYEILVNGADISTMEVQFASETIYKYLPERAAALGVNIPAHYVAIA